MMVDSERRALPGAASAEVVDQRPRIGLTLMVDRPERDTHLPRYSMNRVYFAAIRREGGVPIALVPGCAEEMALFVDGTGAGIAPEAPLALDGICLAGGGDLHPSFFGQEKHPLCGEPDRERDEMEIKLLGLLRGTQVPILAICRGVQVLNAAWGGTLIQDIASQCPQAINHDYMQGYPRDHLAHEIRIAENSLLHRVMGVTTVTVNSLHHQAVDRLADGLVATAWTSDGIVEGLELEASAARSGRFVAGVQFHPEDIQEYETMRRLFARFLDAARVYRDRRATPAGDRSG